MDEERAMKLSKFRVGEDQPMGKEMTVEEVDLRRQFIKNCAKTYISQHHCECGAVTPFVKPLTVMYVVHECGQRTCRYKTNMTGKMFDVPCIKCQAPVTVEWDSKRWQYKTVE